MGFPTKTSLTDRLWRPAWFRRQRVDRERDLELVAGVRELVTDLRRHSDSVLRQRMNQLRPVAGRQTGEHSELPLAEAFAVVVEAIRRALAVDLYDVQLLAGLVLSRQSIAEMSTGEGKTLVASLPAAVHALTGDGVHVMTVNAYLAQRDYELLRPAYRLMGLTVGLTQSGSSRQDKAAAYACDITYGAGYEFGFDYLRDQSVLLAAPAARLGDTCRQRMEQPSQSGSHRSQPVQRGHSLAIIDEVDSVLLDEATTPMILTGSTVVTAPDANAYRAAIRCVDQLVEDRDYVLDPIQRQVQLTPQGARSVCQGDLVPRQLLRRGWSDYIRQALYAREFIHRGTDYVIDQQQRLLLVDPATGRIFDDRTYSDGLHQAIQAKEQIPITAENLPLARISRQRFFQRYQRLCGMTGTAREGQREFRQTYGLDVVTIPTRRPCLRQILPLRSFIDQPSKHRAIVDEIRQVHATGQPILVGTATVAESQQLARLLELEGLALQLLNGIQDEQEARIVARAGTKGMLTLATNMAGRGTDIRLGPGVAALGGLFVIGCQPQASQRIDRQLFGRAARQGDPGCGRLFFSADDTIARQSPALRRRMQRLPRDERGEIHSDLSDDVRRLQRRTDHRQFRRRRRLYLHDDWLDGVLDKLAR